MFNILKNLKKLLDYTIMLPLYWLSYIIPKDEKLWIFGSWFGERYADNSKYLFEYVNKYHPEIKAVWLTSNKKVYKYLKSKGYKVFFKNSLAGFWFSLRAKVAIVCQSKKSDLYPFINDKKTFIVQLWHGIPLKKIGYDDTIFSYKNKSKIRKYLINLFFPFLKEKYSLFIATSMETKKLFSKAFKLDISKVKITGYPRNDVLFSKKGISKKSYKKIIYLPTFRKNIGSKIDLFKPYGFNTKKIDKFLEKLKAKLFIKLHPVNNPDKDILEELRKCKNIIFLNNDIDLYEILGNFDILITDYSSVYFDYLLLDKPIIFAPFDIEEYTKKDREFYYEYDEVTPGPKAKSWDEVLIYIMEAIKNPEKYKEEREKIRNIFHKYKDERSSERVFKEIVKLLNW